MMSFYYKIGLALLLGLLAFTSHAQPGEKDIIRLKNGTIISGKIVTQKPGEYIRILESESEDTIKIPLTEIDLMEKEIIPPPLADTLDTVDHSDNVKTDTVRYFPFSKRYYFFLSLERVIGNLNQRTASVGGFRAFDSGLTVGITARYLRLAIHSTPIRDMFPLTVDLNYLVEPLWPQKHLFIGLSGGLSFFPGNSYTDDQLNTTVKLSNGVYINPVAGIYMDFDRVLDIKLDVGYQYISVQKKAADGALLDTYNWSAVAIRASFIF